MTTTKLPDLLKKFPFLAIISYCGEEYVGIIQNSDGNFINFYDFQSIESDDMKTEFLRMGEQWWWESNRIIPINLFLKEDFQTFRPCLKTFSTKEIKIIAGHMVSLHDFFKKRIKRRSVQLIKRVK